RARPRVRPAARPLWRALRRTRRRVRRADGFAIRAWSTPVERHGPVRSRTRTPPHVRLMAMTASEEHQTFTTAIVPAAGLGTRFLPTTESVPKELLPVRSEERRAGK